MKYKFSRKILPTYDYLQCDASALKVCDEFIIPAPMSYIK